MSTAIGNVIGRDNRATVGRRHPRDRGECAADGGGRKGRCIGSLHRSIAGACDVRGRHDEVVGSPTRQPIDRAGGGASGAAIVASTIGHVICGDRRATVGNWCGPRNHGVGDQNCGCIHRSRCTRRCCRDRGSRSSWASYARTDDSCTPEKECPSECDSYQPAARFCGFHLSAFANYNRILLSRTSV